MVPSKSKDNSRNNVYVKNFPKDFNDEDLRQLFSKYGEISNAIISRDDKGNSKGFGFVCYVSPFDAVNAIKQLKEKNITFPGLPALYVNFAMKKEERTNYSQIESNPNAPSPAFIATFSSHPDIVILFLFLFFSILLRILIENLDYLLKLFFYKNIIQNL